MRSGVLPNCWELVRELEGINYSRHAIIGHLHVVLEVGFGRSHAINLVQPRPNAVPTRNNMTEHFRGPHHTMVLFVVGHSSGGVDWPRSSAPQHSTSADVVTPQLWSPPALTFKNKTDGGLDLPQLSLPQHSTLPDVVTPQLWFGPVLTLRNMTDGGLDSPSLSLPILPMMGMSGS